MNEFRVILPMPKYEGPNGRSHWRARNTQAKADKQLASLYGAIVGPEQPITVVSLVIDWYCATRRMIDTDNAHGRCKYFIDGLTSAGWWRDDKDIRATTIRRWFPGEGAGFKARVVITARPMDQALRLIEIDPAYG